MTIETQTYLVFPQIIIRYTFDFIIIFLLLPFSLSVRDSNLIVTIFSHHFFSEFSEKDLLVVCGFAGSGSESYYYRLLYARHDRL